MRNVAVPFKEAGAIGSKRWKSSDSNAMSGYSELLTHEPGDFCLFAPKKFTPFFQCISISSLLDILVVTGAAEVSRLNSY
jgi:hypothetical protein